MACILYLSMSCLQFSRPIFNVPKACSSFYKIMLILSSSNCSCNISFSIDVYQYSCMEQSLEVLTVLLLFQCLDQLY
jgi:hypothetical protein